jgi:chloride channel protein, CIC family
VVKAIASAVCIGTGGSVGREGPIVQIGSALASGFGQLARMPESRMRILVACGAGGAIAATFNAPITGVFFGVEIILREFAVDALFTVMLAAMLADAIAIPFLGDRPFLLGFPAGIALPHPGDYLLVAALAVLAGLIGLLFKNAVYQAEDRWDAAWKNRPEWARPAFGGLALGLVLLALPQLYGVGYPVMYKAVAGNYALWFLLVLAAGKIIACSLTLGIGGSGGVFAPSLFVGATSGMAFGETASHVIGPAAGPPALYAVVAMGAVFTSAARAPLTSIASVVEMTGDYTLTLPVMLAVALATATSRLLSYGTVYTTKLLRRGEDIDRAAPWRALRDLKAADAMRPFPAPVAVPSEPPPPASGLHPGLLPGQITYQRDPQAVYEGESITQTLRQLDAYGRDGLPVLSGDGSQVLGWITNASVLQAVAAKIGTSPRAADPTSGLANTASAFSGRTSGERTSGGEPARPGGPARPPNPLPGYQVLEIRLAPGSPAAGQPLGALRWPDHAFPVSIQRDRRLDQPDPAITLADGDRINVLTPSGPSPETGTRPSTSQVSASADRGGENPARS